jgi:ABC-2 type transport system ATP-binding protein
MKAIKVRNLSKIYQGDIRAVDGISFDIDEGIIFGFLGPNGAGKSTTIKILVTLIQATSGSGKIFGVDVVKDPSKVREMIGYVPQEISADGALTGYENLMLAAKLYDIPAGERERRIDEVLNIFDLEDRAKDMVKTFSGGMIRRLEIGQSMLHQPRLLFLDEPTIGLDPSGRKLVWEHIRRLNKEKGITIFLTTHYMDEADELCSRIGIINNGKISTVDTPTALKEMVGGGTLTVDMELGEHAAKAEEFLTQLTQGDVVSLTMLSDSKCRFTINNVTHNGPRVIQKLMEQKIGFKDLEIKGPTLEDAFLKLTGNKLDEGASKATWRNVKGRRRTIRRMG